MSARLGKLASLVAIILGWMIVIAVVWKAVLSAQAQMPPSYYGLTPGPPLLAPPSIENAIEPPPGALPIVVLNSPPPPVADPPPQAPLMSFYVLPPPPDVTFDDNPNDLAPLIITRVILTRECFRYSGHWRCTQPK